MLVIVLMGGAILATTMAGARQVVRRLSESWTRQAIDLVDARLEGFFDPVQRGLQMVQAWGQAGMLHEAEATALNHLLVPMLRQHPQISSVIIADGRGREYYLLHERVAWRSRETRGDEWGQRTQWHEWTDAAPQPVSSWKELDYDPRRRPWYANALAARDARLRRPVALETTGELSWTDPYTFFTTQEPGITSSLTYDVDDGIDRVVGFDVLLSDISEFTRRLRVGVHGWVCVLTEDGRVIGLPRGGRFDDPAARRRALLHKPEELALTVAADAVAAFGGPGAAGRDPQRFRSGGEPWWGHVHPYALSPEQRLWIVGAVPEADLLGDLQSLQRWIIAITVVVLAGAILRAVYLAGRYSRPLEALVRQSDRIGEGDLESIEPVESKVTEVRRLAQAQNRMRNALKSLLKIERDLQLARQIQQKTLPGRLPTLVGFEIEAWNEPAEETGGDSYDVIGYRTETPGAPAKLTTDRADRVAFLLADATGHGIGPALSVTQVRAMLRMAIRSRLGLAVIARHMNAQLCADLHGGRFVTAWLGDLDAASGTLSSFSAGQAPLFHFDAGRGEMHVLSADTPPLGILEDLEITIGERIRLGPGDIFAVLSDGLLEAEGPEGGQFGAERAVELITRHGSASPAEIVEALRAAVAAFTGGAPAADDRSVIIIKRNPR